MNPRTDYQREYMRKRRAAEREVRATGQDATATVSEGFTERQFEELQAIVRAELEPLFKLTVSCINKPAAELTNANVNMVCPQCGKAFEPGGRRNFCSDRCRKAAHRHRKKQAGC